MGKYKSVDKYRSRRRKFHGNQFTELGDQDLECAKRSLLIRLGHHQLISQRVVQIQKTR